MNNQLVGSRDTEDKIVNSWHCYSLMVKGRPSIYGEPYKWLLETDEMHCRWCLPASGVNGKGIYFEYQEDLVLFQMKWG